MITKTEFNETIAKFDILEKRGSFYDMAVELINNNFEIEAYLLFLATWNFANFRYAVKDFDINNFKIKIVTLKPYFDKLKKEEFSSTDFNKYEVEIRKIYSTLSSIEGVKYTGASKIMHLKNRKIFVIWDGYIKGNKSRRYYDRLEIVKSGKWKIKKYDNNADDYLDFLKDMQFLFRNIEFEDKNKTFAKAIDEFNYVNITLPIQEIEKQEKLEQKKRGDS